MPDEPVPSAPPRELPLAMVASLGVALAIIAVLLVVAAALATDPDLRGWGAVTAAALLVAVAPLSAAWVLAAARATARSQRDQAASPAARWGDDEPPPVQKMLDPLAWASGWPQALALAVPALAALAVLVLLPPGGGGASQELIPAIIALGLLFPLIAVERWTADQAARGGPAVSALARLLRVPAAGCAAAGFSLLAASMGWTAAWWLQWPVSVLVGAAALELVARAGLALWLPAAPGAAIADSVVAGAVLARLNPLRAVSELLREHAGIDLARSWSARIIGRATLPVLVFLLILAWATTAVTTVAIGTRAVVQTRSGLAVLQAGTHLHAPWPWAVVRRLDDGRLHETVLGTTDEAVARIAADAEPPAAYDRLWDVPHPAEQEFLVPAQASGGGSEGFQIVAGDVRVAWRVGLTDDDAIAAVGRLQDAEDLVGRAARRALTAACAVRPLAEIIATDRDRLGESLRQGVQSDIDRLAGGRSGIAIVAVVVDALHPPVGAATAYQRVQAAEIEARTLVAKAKAGAARSVSAAEVAAVQRRSAATAAAAEAASTAHVAATRFAADREAWATARDAMALERWLAAVEAGLSKCEITVIDHRLDASEAPVLDLRPSSPERNP